MCGIAGFHRLPLSPDDRREVALRMIATLDHRGPDGRGVHIDGDTALAHARLSIIDVAAGAQPMSNEDGTVWVTFNGEIFNYVELRKELMARGHTMRTNSDTEVIVHLYEEMGPDCVQAMNGDFAFAIWDSRRRRMVLARDRMGVRPLFYTLKDGGIAFASEIKALLEVPGVTAELDPIALDQIFTFWFPLAPRTPFRDILELPPAHVLVASDSGITTRPYWRLSYPENNHDLDRRGEDAIADHLRALLLDATRIRLRADVPIGAYLSGGLDSSITSAAIKRFAPDNLRSFSIGFEDEEFDERAFQAEMVRALGTQHTSTVVTSDDIAAALPELIRHTERPIFRTAPAPMMMLAKLVHDNGIKVVLTGEGADEVFAGYDIFKEAKVRRFCARQPGSRFRPLLLRKLYPYLPRLQGQSQKYLEAFFGTGSSALGDPLYSHLPRFRTTIGAKAFYSEEMRERLKDYDALADLRDRLPSEFGRWHPLSQAQYLECAYLMPGYILSSQGDRVAMAHAVEGRFPFLDHRVVELAARIPPSLKLKGLREKHILRKAMAPLLPRSIANRPKQPYRSPESRAFFGANGPSPALAEMSGARVAAAGYFEPRLVNQLVAKCARLPSIGFRDNMAFMGILSTQLWHHRFVRSEAPTHGMALASKSTKFPALATEQH